MKKLFVALFSLGLLLIFQGSVTINAQSPPNYVLATDEDFSGTSNGSFRYIGNDEYVEIPHVIKGVPVTSYYRMFSDEYGANTSTVKGVKSTNTNVTDMSYMFYGSQATELDLSSFDTSNVTDMSFMFWNSQATEIKGLENFDTSNVTDMSWMFANSPATTLDLSSFDTSKVTSMIYMFSGSRATELDLSSFDTSKVTNMDGMFSYSQAIEIQGLESFDTSKVTSMFYMFRDSQATELDLSSFDTSNVTNMSHMFYNSQATKGYARTQADADRFNTSSGKPSSLTFRVKSEDGYVLAVDEDFSGTSNGNFRYIGTDKYVEIPHVIKGVPVTSYYRMFEGTSVKGVKSTNKNVTNMSMMFYDSQSDILDVSQLDTSNVTNMSGMFGSLFGLSKTTKIIGLENFNTSKVTDMSEMFLVSRVTELDLSSFDTSKVTNMRSMFSYSQATKGYARTQADADKLNASDGKPASLNFVVKGTPVIEFTENGNNVYKKTHSTNVNVDGSKANLTSLQYAWSTSTATPTSGWSNFTNGQTITRSSGTGDYYLHVRATSELGITKTKTTNVFKFDNTPPTINVTPNKTEQTHEDITITVTATDSHSGIKRIKLPNGEWINDTTATYVAKSNGEYEFVAEDNAGNTTTETFLVNNIVRTISMELPVISEFDEVYLSEESDVATTDIGSIVISDWRDDSGWRLSVSATPLKLVGESFNMPIGTIKINGLSEILRLDGNGSMPSKTLFNAVIIDDGKVELARGINSQGKYELIFPTNALEATIDPTITKVGTYKTTITWELEHVPQAN